MQIESGLESLVECKYNLRIQPMMIHSDSTTILQTIKLAESTSETFFYVTAVFIVYSNNSYPMTSPLIGHSLVSKN